MTQRLAALLFAGVLLTACAGRVPPSGDGEPAYVHQFNLLYNDRQLAYDRAFQDLGSTTISDLSPDRLRTLFSALAHADDDFVAGIGTTTQDATIETICQAGSFSWKIRFPVNDCPDVAILWKAAKALAMDEGAVAAIDSTSDLASDQEAADLAKVSSALDQWRAAANKVRQDIGLPAQSFSIVGWCIADTTC